MAKSVSRNAAREQPRAKRAPVRPPSARKQSASAARPEPDRDRQAEPHGRGTLSPTGMDQDPLG
jgi:hypothetical protein